ncbi:hypothetical protein J4465_02235 [Candidatus Pacearchaeota archaeon]|nr:hypothetical protein [Candidatus Pacearchaeota archaeon]
MKCIEFMGMPRAGKSTQLELVETVLKHEKKASVRNIYEGARICPIGKENRFQYNSWSFHNTTNRIMEARMDNFDYLLIDRGIYDHIAFTRALYLGGQINKKQYESQIEYFKEFDFLEDAVLGFMVGAQESMGRENKHHGFCGRVMNKDFLQILYEIYNEMIPKIHKECYIVDGSKPLKENGKEILDFVSRLGK